ncbi:MAG: hypothetical protein JEZ11_22200 [Desulfobacterales bacterium]|nr:hypothetical protein [Desulfobacterales bacterium]
MKIIVCLLGIAHIAISSFFILYTKETIDMLKGMFRTYKLRYMASYPIVIGVLFVISASATYYPWVFRIIGLIAFCEAVVAFTDPKKIYSRMLDWYFENVSVRTNQLLGIIGVIFGTLVLTWAR